MQQKTAEKTILQQSLTDKKDLNINSSFQTDAIFIIFLTTIPQTQSKHNFFKRFFTASTVSFYSAVSYSMQFFVERFL